MDTKVLLTILIVCFIPLESEICLISRLTISNSFRRVAVQVVGFVALQGFLYLVANFLLYHSDTFAIKLVGDIVFGFTFGLIYGDILGMISRRFTRAAHRIGPKVMSIWVVFVLIPYLAVSLFGLYQVIYQLVSNP